MIKKVVNINYEIMVNKHDQIKFLRELMINLKQVIYYFIN